MCCALVVESGVILSIPSFGQKGTLSGTTGGVRSTNNPMRFPHPRNSGSAAGEPVCLTSGDCNDNAPCTADLCVAGACQNLPISGCVPCELSYECPPVDVVFLMDTSGSMRDEAAVLCTEVFGIGEELAQAGVVASINSMGITDIPGGPFDCLFDTVVGSFGSTVPGNIHTCAFPDGSAAYETWGPATAIVAQSYPWTPGATRIIIPMSDEGPCNGSRPEGCNDPGDDRDSIDNAIAVALANNVHVSPIAGTGSDDCVLNLGTAIAKATGGHLHQFKNPKSEFRSALLEVIHETCIADANCDDRDACTHEDSCVGGRCVGEPIEGCRVCVADIDCDDQNPCIVDECVGGFCEWSPAFDETQCCSPATGTIIPISDGDPCTDDTCNPETGNVQHVPGGVGQSCDDGLGCTVNDTCDGSGVCGGSDINQQACSTDADCQDAGSCNQTTGFCSCTDSPSLCIRVSAPPNTSCLPGNQLLSFPVQLGASEQSVAGGQFMIVYDPAKLKFVDVVPGHQEDPASIFEVELTEIVDESSGTIFYSVAASGAGVGTKEPAVMAVVHFMPKVSCGLVDSPCFAPDEDKPTFLVNVRGSMVLPQTCCSDPFSVVVDQPTLTCPQSITKNADASRASAVASWSKPKGSSTCDGNLTLQCEGVNPAGEAIDALAQEGGRFAIGTSTFHCKASDSCGRQAECDWSVNVFDEHTVVVDVAISAPMTPLLVSRCLELEFFVDCLHPPLVIQQPVLLGGLFNFPGITRFSLKIPAAQYRCLTVRDPLHTLRSFTMLSVENNQFVAHFQGDPKLGGNWLENGDLNGDGIVDILDHTLFMNKYNTRQDPNTTCEGNTHADFNGDGIVDVNDLVFIERAFNHSDAGACCSFHATASAPVTELSQDQLSGMGLGNLLRFDVNQDNVLNYLDVVGFLNRELRRKDTTGGSK